MLIDYTDSEKDFNQQFSIFSTQDFKIKDFQYTKGKLIQVLSPDI